MELTIQHLTIENFKGVVGKPLDIEFADVTNIRGANGTGKTCIPDAFMWLMFNKDSQGNTPGSDAFREKPLDGDGREIHNLDTTVTARMLLDRKPFNLRRTQRENWVKKRGAKDATLQGNESLYWINDVETKAGDFKDRVSGIATDEIFRLIITLGAFNALPWNKRRSILTGMSDADVDEALLARPKYASVRAELTRRNIRVDELRRVLGDQRRAVNQELQLLPARIDEAHTLRPQISDRERADAERAAKDAQEEIARIDGQMLAIRSQSGLVELQSQIAATETERFTVRRRVEDDAQAAYRRVLSAKTDAETDLRRATQNRGAARSVADHSRDDLTRLTAELKSCQDQYRAEYETKFVLPETVTRTCPTCGQALPEDVYIAAVEKASAAFASARKAALEAITARGDAALHRVEDQKKALAEQQAYLAECEDKRETAQNAADDASAAFAGFVRPDPDADPTVLALTEKLAGLKAGVIEAPDERISAFTARQSELRSILARAQATIAKADSIPGFDRRIADLETKQREYGNTVAEIEVLIGLTEDFVADRCSALEESINELFPTVRWKLFNTQLNGGLEDTCICMIPCGDALVAYGGANTAANVNADIEIARALSLHFGVVAPLFVDNAERINDIASPAGQLITLSVSGDDSLRVEHRTLKEAA